MQCSQRSGAVVPGRLTGKKQPPGNVANANDATGNDDAAVMRQLYTIATHWRSFQTANSMSCWCLVPLFLLLIYLKVIESSRFYYFCVCRWLRIYTWIQTLSRYLDSLHSLIQSLNMHVARQRQGNVWNISPMKNERPDARIRMTPILRIIAESRIISCFPIIIHFKLQLIN